MPTALLMPIPGSKSLFQKDVQFYFCSSFLQIHQCLDTMVNNLLDICSVCSSDRYMTELRRKLMKPWQKTSICHWYYLQQILIRNKQLQSNKIKTTSHWRSFNGNPTQLGKKILAWVKPREIKTKNPPTYPTRIFKLPPINWLEILWFTSAKILLLLHAHVTHLENY